MGGSDDPSNLVELTIEEHAEAHRKLYEEHGRWQDEIAWKALSGSVGQDEIIARKLKSRLGMAHSEETKKKISQSAKSNPKCIEAHIEAGKRHKGKILSNETKQKISAARKGQRLSEETKLKLSESHKNQIPWNKGIKVKSLPPL
jgi:hypothetical protein